MKFNLILFLLISIFNFHCDKFTERKNKFSPPTDAEIETWKEKLSLEEAELKELDQKIRKMVQKSNQTGALAWKIARAYMRSGSFEQGTKYYVEAIASQSGELDGYEIHKFGSALPYFEKAIEYQKIDKQLLFETALAFGNASRDMGWEPERRKKSIQLLKQLIKIDPEDTRFPYQLALVYFDSSVKGSQWEGKTLLQFDERDDAFLLLDQILQKEPYNVPTRFAKANFLYQIGKRMEALAEYERIRNQIEEMTEKGALREKLENNQSYQNVLKNIQTIRSQNSK